MNDASMDTAHVARGSKPPERMCVICRERRPKAALERYVRPATRGPGETGGEALVHDARKIMPGRGYYVCGQERCAERFRQFRVGKRNSRG